jgi:SAM-dependent methyltransferase
MTTGAPATTKPAAKKLTPGAPDFVPVNVGVPGQALEMAIPGAHKLAMEHVAKWMPPAVDGRPSRALDLGAGQGALCVRMREMGYAVQACDMFPEMFAVEGIECRAADLHGGLPYEDNSFDLVCAFEVVEHLEGHRAMFAEVQRILRPGGVFAFTTPNICSLKSRMSFLWTGFFYSHGPLDPAVNNPAGQHIAAFTPDRYRFILSQAGLDLVAVECDLKQGSSVVWGGLIPIIRWRAKAKWGRGAEAGFNNSTAALLGRKLVGIAKKR